MMIKKAITGLVALAAIGFAAVSPANATAVQIVGTTSGVSNAFSYTSGAGVGVNTLAGFQSFLFVAPGGFAPNSHFSFTGLNDIGFLDTSGVDPLQNLTGGTFTLKDQTNTVLLVSGVFSGATLSGAVNGVNTNIHLNFAGVTFTGGTWWNDALADGLVNPGAMAMNITSGLPIAKSGAPGFEKFNSFTGSGSGNLTAQLPNVVPEPGSVVAFVFGALGLCVLALRARRSVRPVA
jgi:hypothetical protein